jgi:TRAP-type C4-dicarboxylate transport system substrate-binding protein
MRRKLFLMMAVIMASVSTSWGQTNIKFATIAPKGTSPAKAVEELDIRLRQASGNKLGLKIYPGAVAGDEIEVLRKMKMGQIHAAGFTGVGFGEILPEVRVLDLPCLFNSYEEVDYVEEKMFPYFAGKFREKGIVLLSWAEVGFVNFYAKSPIKDPADLKGLKVWTWTGDPIAEATLRALDVSPVPLPVTDVLTSLQTGMVDTVYANPLGCVGLQWYTKVKTMTEAPLTHAAGAFLIQASEYDKLDKSLQDLLSKETKDQMAKATVTTRKENAAAIDQMKAAGVSVVPVTPESLAKFKVAADKAIANLKGKVFSEDLLNQVVGLINEYRQSRGATKP